MIGQFAQSSQKLTDLLHKAGLTKWRPKTQKSDILPLRNVKIAKIDHPTTKFSNIFKQICLLICLLRFYKAFYYISSLCEVKLSVNLFYCIKFDYINVDYNKKVNKKAFDSKNYKIKDYDCKS